MNKPLLHVSLLVALLCAACPAAQAEKTRVPASPAAAAVPAAPAASDATAADPGPAPDQSSRDEADWDSGVDTGAIDTARSHGHGRHHRHGGNSLVSIGHDAHLESGKQADSVVSIFGS